MRLLMMPMVISYISCLSLLSVATTEFPRLVNLEKSLILSYGWRLARMSEICPSHLVRAVSLWDAEISKYM